MKNEIPNFKQLQNQLHICASTSDLREHTLFKFFENDSRIKHLYKQ